MAMASANSWHPAFMPNSLADDIILKRSTPPSDHAPAPEPASAAPVPAPDAAQVEAPVYRKDVPAYIGEEEQLRPQTPTPTPQPLNDENTDLDKLRDALTTSLASPGGVEMDESPEHNGISNSDPEQDQKADFPSEGPTPSKHMSTMSFTRTVSEDVSWAEEEDDFVPEISVVESDPFKDMAKLDRSNSFPQVPAAHAPAKNTQPLHTEVEEIIMEAERPPEDLFADGGTEDDFFGQNATPSAPEEVFDLSNQAPDFEQARFEEGLPLVQPQENFAQSPAPVKPFFAGEREEDEDEFFTQVSQSAPTQQPIPPHLARKSTVQVLDNMHFGPSGERSAQSNTEEDTAEMDQSMLEKTNGGGVAASKSTIMSEIFGDSEPTTTEETEPTEEDLAAKWKEALAGDDFLDDDDDLLPDDEPTRQSIDPAELFGSDDEGFLDDIDESNDSANFFTQPQNNGISSVLDANGQVVGFDSLTGPGQNTRPGSSEVRPGSSSSRYLPSQYGASQSFNKYAPAAPQVIDHSRTATAGSVQPSPYGAPVTPFPGSQPQQRPEAQKAQSFANQAKGGYHSPYDLPMDVLPARKRPSMAQMKTVPAPLLPPRKSSINSPLAPPPSQSTVPELASTQSNGQQLPLVSNKRLPGPPTLKAKASFFEELPMTSRPKVSPRNVTAPVTLTANTYPPPTGPPALPPPQAVYSPSQQASQAPQAIPYGHGLVAPERAGPFTSLPAPNVIVPSKQSRYSPAPPPQPHSQTAPLPPSGPSRYSPAPPLRQASYNNPPLTAPQPPFLSHQPRTSSPLAQFSQGQQGGIERRSSSSYESSLKSHLPPTREVDELRELNGEAARQEQSPHTALGTRFSQTPPPSSGLASRLVASPPKRINLNQGSKTSPPQPVAPPKRSQTQSPSALASRYGLTPNDASPRPASVEASEAPRNHVPPQPSAPKTARPRGFSHGVNYIAPVDGRELDSMQRWRGGPVFVWGVGGTIVTSFPKDVPRYGMNQTMPMMLRSPGQVNIKSVKDIDPLPDRLSSFPGPLKGKSKKKDTVLWLTAGIELLEKDASYLRTISTLNHDDKRIEERILLWKILRVFVDNDGILEGNPVVDKAVRAVLSPGLDDELVPGASPLYATGADLSGISQSSSAVPRAEPIDPTAVDQLRKHLLRGDREKAVWDAVDKRLWAHAMLISNTVSKDLYKRVCQEFVQKEVKNIGSNTESLAALYEIFAGNLEESIDELVTPSARAGFQMVNTSGTGGLSKDDALDGLDRWRETLGLVLSNRSVDDNQALDALGKLLSGYGRAEAAHICFLFARSHSVFGGIDLPATSMVLVGSDHLRQPFEFDREMEPILLSEVFEYGMSLSSTSNVAVSSPHLSIYKLQHALILAEYGYREKALEYCESIAASMHSQTRTSPYHHPLLNSQVEDLTKRLKQSPKDAKSGWISKPSVEKVSSSFFQKFNSFVAGEDNDVATPDSAANGESGPFARISGGTPTISRSPSNSDLYGSYNGGIGINGTLAQAAKSNRYTPGGSHTPPSYDFQQGGSSFGSQPRTSLEGRPSGEYKPNPYEPVRRDSDFMPPPQIPGAAPYTAQFSPSYGPGAFSPYSHSFPGNGSPYAPQPSSQLPRQPSNLISPHQNTFESAQPSSLAQISQPEEPEQPSHEAQGASSYEPPTSGYQPYEAPAYEPNAMNDEDSPIDTKPKKKSFMDDDEDDYKPMAAAPADASQKSKADKDREADEAFRKAAEADAARAKESAPAKKGWGLGGWFGKSKEPDMNAAPGNKPIRAKLGEQSSFYYDQEQKRWVNKKGGGESTPAAGAAPPPPRAPGPPRSASNPSASLGPPTSAPRMPPPSRNVSGLSDGTGDAAPADPPSSAPPGMALSAPPGMSMSRQASNGSVVSATGPPSRPGTSMSNASSIDDLLGAAAPRKAGAKGKAAKGKKSRYIDVMADKAG